MEKYIFNKLQQNEIPDILICQRRYIPYPKPSDICFLSCIANRMETQEDKENVCKAMQDMISIRARCEK